MAPGWSQHGNAFKFEPGNSREVQAPQKSLPPTDTFNDFNESLSVLLLTVEKENNIFATVFTMFGLL